MRKKATLFQNPVADCLSVTNDRRRRRITILLSNNGYLPEMYESSQSLNKLRHILEGMARYAGQLLAPAEELCWLILAHVWCSVVTLVIFSSNINNVEKKV